jgi:uncharacterized protein (DUF362 family)
MPESTRREFLKRLAAGGALTLGGLPALADEAAPFDMSIARWAGEPLEGELMTQAATRLTERAMELVGGMGRFVSKGHSVWVKPNMAWNRSPEQAANTNPDVVATLVRLCFEAGAKSVKVGDHTCHKAKQAYRRSGIAAAAEAAGAEVVTLNSRRFEVREIGGRRLERWQVYPEIVDSDLVINVPVAKHHGLADATFCMKNYMGVVGGQRSAWHQDLHTCLVEITRYMKPRLCVLDAMRILTAHGPQGGNPDDVEVVGAVAAGTDIVAMDALGAELMGHEPTDIASIRAGHAAKLGEIDFRKLAYRAEELS